jgi:hypothetical protein
MSLLGAPNVLGRSPLSPTGLTEWEAYTQSLGLPPSSPADQPDYVKVIETEPPSAPVKEWDALAKTQYGIGIPGIIIRDCEQLTPEGQAFFFPLGCPDAAPNGLPIPSPDPFSKHAPAAPTSPWLVALLVGLAAFAITEAG